MIPESTAMTSLLNAGMLAASRTLLPPCAALALRAISGSTPAAQGVVHRARVGGDILIGTALRGATWLANLSAGGRDPRYRGGLVSARPAASNTPG